MKEEFKKILGKHIRRRRQELNLTIEELSLRTDIDDKHLGRIERGEKLPNSFTLAKLQLILNLNSDVYLSEFKELFNKNNQQEK